MKLRQQKSQAFLRELVARHYFQLLAISRDGLVELADLLQFDCKIAVRGGVERIQLKLFPESRNRLIVMVKACLCEPQLVPRVLLLWFLLDYFLQKINRIRQDCFAAWPSLLLCEAAREFHPKREKILRAARKAR